MTDPATLDALGQAELTRSRQASAEELVRSAIDRIERLDPPLNAVITRRFEAAVEDARRGAAASSVSPLFGVPMLLKDAICHSAGDPFHCGMRVLKEIGWVEPDDTFLARRFRAAGLIFLGKSNTPELAGSTTTEPLAYGPTRNPWDLGRSAGGSSGGSAAAVAAGLVPIAHGNDMGGSIRIPAAACGVVGLKPSRARVSLGPDFGEYLGSVTHEHVITRTVRDSAAVLDLIAGYELGDPYAAPPPADTFLAAVSREPGRRRVGVLDLATPGGPAIASECRQAIDEAARMLDALGHEVVTVRCPPFWERPSPGGRVGAVHKRQDVERWGRRIGRPIGPDEVEPLTAYWMDLGAGVTATEYVTLVQEGQRWARALVASWRAQCEVLLTPTLPELLPRIGEMAPGNAAPVDILAKMNRHTFFTAPFNVTGEPAISLPLHWTAAGSPVGVQVVAPYGQDELLLSVAGQLERALPWHRRYPAQAIAPSPMTKVRT